MTMRGTTLGLVLGCMMLSACSSGGGEGGKEGAAGPMAEAVKVRQNKYKQIGKANKAIGEEMKKPAPSLAVLQPNAKIIADLAPDLPNWFPAGSGPEAGVKTEALPAVWEKPAEFKAASDKFTAAAVAFNTAAAAGDMAQVSAAAPDLGGSCKNCHQTFRQKK